MTSRRIAAGCAIVAVALTSTSYYVWGQEGAGEGEALAGGYGAVADGVEVDENQTAGRNTRRRAAGRGGYGGEASRAPDAAEQPAALGMGIAERGGQRLRAAGGYAEGIMMGMPTPPDPFAVWNPQERPLHRAAQELAERHASAQEEEQRAEIVEELHEVVEKQFDLRQQGRAEELDALERELARLRDTHQRREEQKEEIVQDRVEDLLRDAEGLGWGSTGSHGGLPGGRGLRSVREIELEANRALDASRREIERRLEAESSPQAE